MISVWEPSLTPLFGHPCLRHTKTGELALFGNYGQIWEYDSYAARVLIHSPRIARRFLPESEWPVAHGEVLLRVRFHEASVWIKRLSVPRKASTQIDIANHIHSGARDQFKEVSIAVKDDQDESRPTPAGVGYPSKSRRNSPSRTRNLAKTGGGS